MSIFFHLSCFFLGSKKRSHLNNTTAIVRAGLRVSLDRFTLGELDCNLGECWISKPDGMWQAVSHNWLVLQPETAGAMWSLPLGLQQGTAAEEHSNRAGSLGSAR